MLQEKIKKLFSTIGASNLEIANYAGCTPSTISRLRSGARTPKPQSPTISTLIFGVIEYSKDNSKTPALLELIGIEDKEMLDTGIRRWLYTDNSIVSNKNDFPNKPLNPIDSAPDSAHPSFSKKLDTIMTLCEMQNVKLAKLVNVDTSYISRFRNGIRSPKSNPELLDRICTALFEQTITKKKLHELAKIINVPQSSADGITGKIPTEELYLRFHIWMDDFSSSDHDAIRHLLGTIDTFSPDGNVTIPSIDQLISDDLINDTSTTYCGISGLQKAVLRFLSSAAMNKYEELFLYSDQDMDWMLEDSTFLARWGSLMAICAMQGTHITIIHNLERDITEMIAAIENWLPLYVSGMVKSYYHKKPAGLRFKHTLFLSPGNACISAFHANGMDDKSIYNYYTDPTLLRHLNDNYDHLMKESGSLISIQQGIPVNINNHNLSQDNYNNLLLSITQNKVIIIKHTTPQLTISFTHPLLCNAFHTYLEKSKQFN